MNKNNNNVWVGGTYISNIAMKKLNIKRLLQVGIGGFFLFLCLFGLIMGFTEQGATMREGRTTYIVLLVPFALIFAAGIKNKRKLDLARRYDSIFMCDVNGTVTIDEISRQVGKPPFKVLSELEWFFRKGVFRDCTLQKQGMPCVILSGRENSKTGFVTVVCEKCNGTTRLRVGSSGKCEYCGSPISRRKTINQ